MVGAQTSKTVLRIYCNSFLVYLRTIKAAIGTIAMGSFASRGSTGYLKNSDLGDGNKLGKVIKGHFWWKQPRP